MSNNPNGLNSQPFEGHSDATLPETRPLPGIPEEVISSVNQDVAALREEGLSPTAIQRTLGRQYNPDLNGGHIETQPLFTYLRHLRKAEVSSYRPRPRS